MKRKSLIAVLAAIMVMLGSTVAFAAPSLQVVSSFPEDGQTNTSMENLGVKVIFNNDVNDSKLEKSNDKLIKLVDADGKTVPCEILYSNKDGKMMLVVADTVDSKYKVLNNAEYKLTIGAGFTDNDGNVLV